ncbi:MAG: DUF126 domain-containing protein [Bacteroidota bacterium]|nr:DUF126 domain-containing protein [Bacteroidota bacterium]MDE2833578.1 DUF126 domain-containing protein [Bacteroidota bacterium]
MGLVIQGRVLVPGEAEGVVMASDEPLSFWGGYDQVTGEIIDRRHPLSGRNAANAILAIPASKGSSTTTAVLLEAIRRRTAPAALITQDPDSFLTLASVVADELFRCPVPVVALGAAEFRLLRSGQHARVCDDGRIEIRDGIDHN